jgi:hypothetical protein
MTPGEGIREILNAGGIPVWAHPIFLFPSMAQLDLLLGELAKIRINGY